MAVEINDVNGFAALANSLRQVFEQELNLKGSEQEIARVISDQNSQEFSNEAGPDGSPWTPLSKAYAIRKKRIAPSRGILQLSGALRGSLENPQISLSADGREMTVAYTGEHAGLAAIHSAGAPSRNLPRRVVGGLSQRSADAISEIAFKRVVDGFAKRLKGKR